MSANLVSENLLRNIWCRKSVSENLMSEKFPRPVVSMVLLSLFYSALVVRM